MIQKIILLFFGSLLGLLFLNPTSAIPGKRASSSDGEISVLLKPAAVVEWHHCGDLLEVKKGEILLLKITLGIFSNDKVPLALTLGSEGHIFRWGDDFKNKDLPAGETTYTLFHSNGDLAQGYRTVLWATFKCKDGSTGHIKLALPEEGLQFWDLKRIDDHNATLFRTIDPSYRELLTKGGKFKDPGVWGPAANNCILYISFDGSYRQYCLSLPWPSLSANNWIQ
jgi:hypothetical protein